MDSVEKVIKDSEFALENLRHLESIHGKWVESLNTSNWENRPIGYANQVDAIQIQEKAFANESDRYLETLITEWLSSIKFVDVKEMEMLRESFRTAAKIMTVKIKEATSEEGKGASEEPTLGL